MRRLVWSIPLVLLVLIGGAVAAEQDAPSATTLTFEQHIRPIFKTHCFDCHGSHDELEAGLDLRLRRFAVKGGESGPAIVPGDSQASYLYRRVVTARCRPGTTSLLKKRF